MEKLIQIPLKDIEVDNNQIRQDLVSNELAKESIKELAASIKSQGVIQPIVVYKDKGKFKLIAGERRVIASNVAHEPLRGDETIPAVVYESKPNQTAIDDIQFAENMHRINLSVYEIIAWLLPRLEKFEKEKGRAIKAPDIEKILSVKKSQAYKYLDIFKADRGMVLSLIDPAVGDNIKSLNDLVSVINHQPNNDNRDEQNQIEEKTTAVKDYIPLNFKSTNSVAMKKLILKNSPAKLRRQYESVDWESPQGLRTAWKLFLVDWESKN